MNNQGPHDNNQFVISYELLMLFRWLFEYEPEAIEKLTQRALSKGLQNILFDPKIKQNVTNEELQHSILDFFSLCEVILHQQLNESEFKQLMQRNLLPVLDHIDASSCDTYTVALSADKAANIYSNNPSKNPKDILCKELLRRWKPSKKLSTN